MNGELMVDSRGEFLEVIRSTRDLSETSVMRRRYRRSLLVGRTSTFRRVLLKGSWICVFFHRVRHRVAVASSFLFALVLFPFVASWIATLYFWRLLLRLLAYWRYPTWSLIETHSLRCALDTRRWPGLVVGLVLLDDANVTLTELRPRILGLMEAQMRVHSNLRRRITRRFGCYFWRTYEQEPDAEDHLITWNKRANNENQLQELVGTISSRPLASDRSPWEVVLIPFGRRWSILIRAHHLLVDGDFPLEKLLRPTSIGLWTDRTPPLLRCRFATVTALSSLWSQFFLKWTWQGFNSIHFESILSFSPRKSNLFESFVRLTTRVRFPSFDMLVWLIQAPTNSFFCSVLFFWRSFVYLLCRIFSTAWLDLAASTVTNEAAVEIRECVKLALVAPHVIATQLTFRAENVPLLRANVSPGYRVLAWTPPVTNTLLQRVAEAGRASEEHVLLAAIAGSLRHFLLTNGAHVPDSVSAIIPVAVGERHTRAFALVDLPTGEWDPCARLRLVRRQLAAVEERPLHVIVGAIAMEWATVVLPQPLLTMALNFLSRRHPVTVCCVNAPSGRSVSPVVEATRLFYWRPPQGNAGLTFTLLLGDEQVTMAVASSQRVLPKPSVLTSQFSREIHAMAVALRVKLDKKWTKLPASKN